jgi:hypothetical protein
MTAQRAEAYGRIMRALRARFGPGARGVVAGMCDVLVLARSASRPVPRCAIEAGV